MVNSMINGVNLKVNIDDYILNALKEKKEHVVIGGGDTVGAINNLGFKNTFPNISSGGGATLEYIATGTLPGIEAIGEEDEIEVLDL